MADGEFGVSEPSLLVEALAPVLSSFNALGVRHYVGGSVASSFHGAARSTMDVDLVCELNDQQVTKFARLLGENFYLSEPAIREAVSRKSSFNLIHLPTSFKIDIFLSRGRPFDIDSMNRASMQQLGTGQVLNVPICTAEDSIISKLEWYRQGNETSDRQWEDVSRLVKLLGDEADIEYLMQAAESVAVRDLLERLLGQS